METDLWDSVIEKAERQRAKGLAKYGKPVTADETVDWLEEAIQEQMDSAVYMEAAKKVFDRLRQKVVDREAEVFLLAERNSALLTECAHWSDLVGKADKTVANLREELDLWKRKEAEAREEISNTKQMALDLQKRKVEELESHLRTEHHINEQRVKFLQEERAKVKQATEDKERAERDTAAVLRRLKEYHRSEGTLALVASGCCLAVGLLVGYLLF